MASPITPTRKPTDPAWYVAAMESLVGVVQALSQARTVDNVTAIVRDAARNLTGADGASFVLRDGDQCYYADENAITPLWKGSRFPMSACVSGWVMEHAQSTVIEDIYADPRVPADAYRPTFVKSMAMVPIRRSGPIGAIGNYWSTRHAASPQEMAILQALADTTSVALENVSLLERLSDQVRALRDQQDHIAEQRDTLEVFTRALAHDLREPVRTMRSFSRMALDPSNRQADRDQYLKFIRNAADRMGVLVDSVFQFMQSHDPAHVIATEQCSVSDMLNAVREDLSHLIRERGATVDGANLPTIEASPTCLRLVLQNLIANAIRHNPRAVKIKVSAQERPGDWLFTVSDDGVGVPPEHAERVFQPFKRLTSNDQSAGLGLAICEKSIAHCGGAIWCERKAGPGATFSFTLPRPSAGSAALAPDRQHDVQGIDASLACMLLVDDRMDDLTLSRVILARKGLLRCRMLVAASGAEALEILRREHVDLVLLDINMPGLDGFDVLEQMRKDQSLSRVAVVMCSGSAYEEDKRRAMALGARGYIVKPLSFDSFQSQLVGIPNLQLVAENDGRSLRRVAG